MRDLLCWIGVCITFQGFVKVFHRITDEATYANVQWVMPLGKNQARLQVSKDFLRRKARTATTPSDEASKFETADDDVPF